MGTLWLRLRPFLYHRNFVEDSRVGPKGHRNAAVEGRRSAGARPTGRRRGREARTGRNAAGPVLPPVAAVAGGGDRRLGGRGLDTGGRGAQSPLRRRRRLRVAEAEAPMASD